MANPRAIRAGRAFVELGVNDKLTGALNRIQARMKAFGRSIGSLGLKSLGAGLTLGFPMAKMIGEFSDFETTMLTLKAVTEFTAQEFANLTKKAKMLGQTTAYTSNTVAEALVILGKAGFSAKEVDQSIEAVLRLARATGAELPQATDYASTALRAFELDASQMGYVVDVLAAAANGSQVDINDLGESMKYAAPIAQEFGTSIAETAKLLGIMGNFGIKGSMAGTSLRQLMLSLASSKTQAKVRGMGIELKKADGSARGFGDIMIDIGKALEDLDQLDKLAILDDLFERRAATAGVKLTKKQFEELEKAMDNVAGTTERAAEIIDSGMGGALLRAKGALLNVRLAIEEIWGPTAKNIATQIVAASGHVIEFAKAHKQLVIVIGLAVPALIAFGVAMVATGVAINAVGSIFGILATAIGFVASLVPLLVGVFTTLGTVVATVIGGIVSGFAAVATAVVGAIASMGFFPVIAAIAAIVAGLYLFKGTAIGAFGSARDAATGAFGYIKDAATSAFDAISAGISVVVSDVSRSFAAIGQELVKGDIAAAVRVMWSLIKLEWTQGVYAIKKLWADVKYFFVDIWNSAVNQVTEWMLDAWYGVAAGWANAVGGMINIWTLFSGTVKKLWAGVQNFFEKKWIDILALFDDDIDVNLAKEMSDADYEREKAAIDEVDAANKMALKDKLDGIKKEHKLATSLLKQQEMAEKAARDKKYEDSLAAAKAEVDAARSAWEQSLLGDPMMGVSDLQDQYTSKFDAGRKFMQEQAAQAEQGAQGAPAAAALSLGSQMGSFNSAAAFGFGSGPLERVAKSSEETAKNTKKISEKKGVVFG